MGHFEVLFVVSLEDHVKPLPVKDGTVLVSDVLVLYSPVQAPGGVSEVPGGEHWAEQRCDRRRYWEHQTG